MKFLITGAGGQLGREWMERLKKSPHEAAGFGSDTLDVTNRKSVAQVLDNEHPDVVINCAAYTAVDDAEDNEETAFRVNRDGAANVADACKSRGIMLVHYSTDYVFEGTEQDKQKFPDGYPEDHPANPQNVYGASKRAGEEEIRRIGGNWLILRVSWLCGAYGNNFIKTMLRFSKEKNELKVVNDQTGSPTFCSDVVDKTIELVDLDQKGYFHISSAGAITWYELTEEILKQTERSERVTLRPVSSAQFASKASRPSFSLLNCSKLKEAGLEQLNWKDGLRELINRIN